MNATVTQHTQGPWQVVQNGGRLDVHSAKVSDGGLAREFTVATDVRPADARLIATAPEMLEALKAMLAYSERSADTSSRSAEVEDAARAAIAKATNG